jgi:hypothetical protein
MNEAVATIIGTLAVAALGGLTIVAYKHSKAYQKLFSGLGRRLELEPQQSMGPHRSQERSI